jgi:hypothetical protein
VEVGFSQGAPFDVSPLLAQLGFTRFLLRLMTSQTSGAGRKADKPGAGQL